MLYIFPRPICNNNMLDTCCYFYWTLLGTGWSPHAAGFILQVAVVFFKCCIMAALCS